MLKVLVNQGGGAAAAAGPGLADTLTQAFAEAGVEAEVRLLDGADMPDAVRLAADEDKRVVVAGGDGTLACAAQALKGRDTELAVLPLGTLNHLARDVGIPGDIAAAAALAANGVARPIDVGEVNGRRFVNNASIGIYPAMVRHREAAQRRKGWPKWLARIPAAWAALRRMPHHRLRIDMGAGEQVIVTPMLFIGNNRYALEPGRIGQRAVLDDGLLSVFALAGRSRRALLWFVLRVLFGWVDPATDFEAFGDCATLKLWSSGGTIEVALDGEVHRMTSPLNFSIDAGALRIVADTPPG